MAAKKKRVLDIFSRNEETQPLTDGNEKGGRNPRPDTSRPPTPPGGQGPIVQSISLDGANSLLMGTLQVVAQMRKAQRRYFAALEKGEKQNYLIEAKRLENAVDIRLGSIGIMAIED